MVRAKVERLCEQAKQAALVAPFAQRIAQKRLGGLAVADEDADARVDDDGVERADVLASIPGCGHGALAPDKCVGVLAIEAQQFQVVPNHAPCLAADLVVAIAPVETFE